MRSCVVVLLLFSSGALGELQCWDGICYLGDPEYPRGCPTDPSSSLTKTTCSEAALNSNELCSSSVYVYDNSSIEWVFGCDPSPDDRNSTGCFHVGDLDTGYYWEICYCDTPLCNAPHMNLTTPSPTTQPETTAQPEPGELQCWQGECFPDPAHPDICSPDPSSFLKKTTCSASILDTPLLCGSVIGYLNSSLAWAFDCNGFGFIYGQETGCFDVTDLEYGVTATLCLCDTPLCNAPDAQPDPTTQPSTLYPLNPLPTTQPSASARASASTLAILFAVVLFILPSLIV